MCDVHADTHQHADRHANSDEHTDTNEHPDEYTNADSDADVDADEYAHGYTHRNADADRHADEHANVDADGHADEHCDADHHRDGDADLDGYADTDQHAHRHTDGHADGHADRYCDSNRHADEHTDGDEDAEQRDRLLSVWSDRLGLRRSGCGHVRPELHGGVRRDMSRNGPLRDVHAHANHLADADTHAAGADRDPDPGAVNGDANADEHTGRADAVRAELPRRAAERAGSVHTKRGAGLQSELAMRGH